MLFRIAEANKQRAAHAFTVERIAHDYGYKKSAMLYPKSNRIMHYYEIDVIDADRIICTVRHKNTDCIVALVWLSGYTPESIEVDQAELYRNCSNYPYRREYNEKYLKKYDQIACVVHGAIINGLLFDTESDKEPEAVKDTTPTETEPQRATESAQKTAVDTTTAGSDTDRTEAAQTAEKTIQTGARLYSHPHRHMVTVAGLQEGLVMVVYRGRLYLVSRGDLYTDETETTPAILPAEPAEATQPAAVIPMENDTTSATKGTESATATTGRERTQDAAQNAQNAHRATKAQRAIQRHTAPHKRPYRATQRAAKSIMRHSPTTATGRRPAEKSHFLAGMGSAKILGQDNHPPPILTHFFDRFLKRFLSGRKSDGGTGVKNLLQILERKIFKKILKGR